MYGIPLTATPFCLVYWQWSYLNSLSLEDPEIVNNPLFQIAKFSLLSNTFLAESFAWWVANQMEKDFNRIDNIFGRGNNHPAALLEVVNNHFNNPVQYAQGPNALLEAIRNRFQNQNQHEHAL
jgi:hypothetical protein